MVQVQCSATKNQSNGYKVRLKRRGVKANKKVKKEKKR